MPWFKVDDAFHSNKKVMRLPAQRRNAALGLWTLAGSWCASALTDGALDRQVARRLGGTSRQAADLVDAGLWIETETGYQFPNWTEYQPTREDTEQRRLSARERMAQRRNGSREQNANTKHVRENFATPDPTRPIPKELTPSELGRRTMRATSLPPKWTPSEESRRVILSECPNVDLRTEHPKFEDYWIGTGKPMKNWDAVWRNWMRRASERGPTRRTTSRSQQQLETNLAAWDLWAADDDDPPRKAIG